jgi:polyisoprenoid-binding protein YceI
MRLTILCLALASLLLAGCGQSGGGTVSTGGSASQSGAAGSNDDGTAGSGAATLNAAGIVSIESGVATLGPENTLIQFVGTHVGDKPDPRTCNFQKFSGTAQLDTDGTTLNSVSVEIETNSLATFHPDLTRHLNSPDFFDTKEYPKATFQSTSIGPPDADGKVHITGDLTLLEETREIAFAATVRVGDQGLYLVAEFDIDRTEFGMDRLQERVENIVGMTVIIGQKTELPK